MNAVVGCCSKAQIGLTHIVRVSHRSENLNEILFGKACPRSLLLFFRRGEQHLRVGCLVVALAEVPVGRVRPRRRRRRRRVLLTRVAESEAAEGRRHEVGHLSPTLSLSFRVLVQGITTSIASLSLSPLQCLLGHKCTPPGLRK